MKKRSLALLLALLLLLPALPAARADFAGYTDVSEEDWFAEAVAFVSRYGYMQGEGTSLFSPYGNVNRGMVATILYRIEGEPETGRCPFTDVPAGKWYSDAVAWAGNVGIVNGVGNGRFDPEGLVTRQQLIAILYRYAMGKGWDVPAEGYLYEGLYPDPESGELAPRSFSDGWRVAEYAKVPMLWAVNRGVFVDMSTPEDGEREMDPDAQVIRAELAAELMNLFQNVANVQGQLGRTLLSSGLYESEDGQKQVYVGGIRKDGTFDLSVSWVRLAGAEDVVKIIGGRASFEDWDLAGTLDMIPGGRIAVTVTRGSGYIKTGESFEAAFVTESERTRRVADSLYRPEGQVWFSRDYDTDANRYLTFGKDGTLEIVATENFQSDNGVFRMSRRTLGFASDGLDIFTVDGLKYRMDTDETAFVSLYIRPLEGDPYGLAGSYTLEDASDTGYTDLPENDTSVEE